MGSVTPLHLTWTWRGGGGLGALKHRARATESVSRSLLQGLLPRSWYIVLKVRMLPLYASVGVNWVGELGSSALTRLAVKSAGV